MMRWFCVVRLFCGVLLAGMLGPFAGLAAHADEAAPLVVGVVKSPGLGKGIRKNRSGKKEPQSLRLQLTNGNPADALAITGAKLSDGLQFRSSMRFPLTLNPAGKKRKAPPSLNWSVLATSPGQINGTLTIQLEKTVLGSVVKIPDVVVDLPTGTLRIAGMQVTQPTQLGAPIAAGTEQPLLQIAAPLVEVDDESISYVFYEDEDADARGRMIRMPNFSFARDDVEPVLNKAMVVTIQNPSTRDPVILEAAVLSDPFFLPKKKPKWRLIHDPIGARDGLPSFPFILAPGQHVTWYILVKMEMKSLEKTGKMQGALWVRARLLKDEKAKVIKTELHMQVRSGFQCGIDNKEWVPFVVPSGNQKAQAHQTVYCANKGAQPFAFQGIKLTGKDAAFFTIPTREAALLNRKDPFAIPITFTPSSDRPADALYTAVVTLEGDVGYYRFNLLGFRANSTSDILLVDKFWDKLSTADAIVPKGMPIRYDFYPNSSDWQERVFYRIHSTKEGSPEKGPILRLEKFPVHTARPDIANGDHDTAGAPMPDGTPVLIRRHLSTAEQRARASMKVVSIFLHGQGGLHLAYSQLPAPISGLSAWASLDAGLRLPWFLSPEDKLHLTLEAGFATQNAPDSHFFGGGGAISIGYCYRNPSRWMELCAGLGARFTSLVDFVSGTPTTSVNFTDVVVYVPFSLQLVKGLHLTIEPGLIMQSFDISRVVNPPRDNHGWGFFLPIGLRWDFLPR